MPWKDLTHKHVPKSAAMNLVVLYKIASEIIILYNCYTILLVLLFSLALVWGDTYELNSRYS